jgi:hypothetical protein
MLAPHGFQLKTRFLTECGRHTVKKQATADPRGWAVDGEKFNVLNGASGIAGCYARAPVTNAGDFRAAPPTRTSADGAGRWRGPGPCRRQRLWIRRQAQ